MGYFIINIVIKYSFKRYKYDYKILQSKTSKTCVKNNDKNPDTTKIFRERYHFKIPHNLKLQNRSVV